MADTYQELLNIDTVLDRLFVRHRDKHEPDELTLVIAAELNVVFTGHRVDKRYVESRISKIRGYQEKLEHLITMPKVEQRSKEWFKMRQTRITASDFAQALGQGKFGTQKQFIQKKCGYEPDTFDSNCAPCVWGTMYEPVAIDAYTHKHSMKLHDFGLLPHPDLSWFGASPDSITELGIMVEIKCPYKRKITGEIPLQYQYQMQGQLDCCDLDECDFLECEFIEYANENDFKTHFEDNTNPKGVIVEYMRKGERQYFYSRYEDATDACALIAWKQSTMDSNEKQADMTFARVHFWQLNTFSVVRYYRDPEFIRTKLLELEKVWDRIVCYKADKSAYDRDMAVVKKPVATSVEHITLSVPACIEPPPQKFSKQKNAFTGGWAFLSDSEDDS
jgi:putative phage-type endonuclease